MYVRMQSLTQHEIEAAHADWEHAVDRYERRLRRIRPKLPKSLRYLLDNLYLHDADVLSIAHNGDTFVIVLQSEVLPKDLVVVTYKLAGKPVLDFAALPREHCTTHIQWMYDEVDVVSPKKLYSHEILFSNGWHVRLRFRAVEVIVAHRLLQPEASHRSPRRAVARSA
jgi:hypothetical protein